MRREILDLINLRSVFFLIERLGLNVGVGLG